MFFWKTGLDFQIVLFSRLEWGKAFVLPKNSTGKSGGSISAETTVLIAWNSQLCRFFFFFLNRRNQPSLDRLIKSTHYNLYLLHFYFIFHTLVHNTCFRYKIFVVLGLLPIRHNSVLSPLFHNASQSLLLTT